MLFAAGAVTTWLPTTVPVSVLMSAAIATAFGLRAVKSVRVIVPLTWAGGEEGTACIGTATPLVRPSGDDRDAGQVLPDLGAVLDRGEDRVGAQRLDGALVIGHAEGDGDAPRRVDPLEADDRAGGLPR